MKRFANIARQLRKNKVLPSSQRIRSDFFQNDKVKIIGGRKDVDRVGIVQYVDKKNNRITVAGLNTCLKKVQSGVISIEQPIEFKNVRLIDPATDEPTTIRWIDKVDPVSKIVLSYRKSDISNEVIPVPKRDDPFKSQKMGPNDTPSDIVNKITFQPELDVNPFPIPLWNQMLKLRRYKKENAVF